ncbi:hypothetical protein [Trichoplusia ni single nucleopolyhedrovirus]|uniref:Uncharacterized protein n=1 Tax=Trichoplusia ni single nucleopolyhedrovirus TaxID=332054 RepID=Q462G0_9ABAC|nr:hypothetical protein TNSV_gp007 [Trichoplusia ni single nucleopolyhedrovirus]AAZ67376.1 hypothetical protein [Trichoplusia ni single nucleopolyhedrovirus]
MVHYVDKDIKHLMSVLLNKEPKPEVESFRGCSEKKYLLDIAPRPRLLKDNNLFNMVAKDFKDSTTVYEHKKVQFVYPTESSMVSKPLKMDSDSDADNEDNALEKFVKEKRHADAVTSKILKKLQQQRNENSGMSVTDARHIVENLLKVHVQMTAGFINLINNMDEFVSESFDFFTSSDDDDNQDRRQCEEESDEPVVQQPDEPIVQQTELVYLPKSTTQVDASTSTTQVDATQVDASTSTTEVEKVDASTDYSPSKFVYKISSREQRNIRRDNNIRQSLNFK